MSVKYLAFYDTKTDPSKRPAKPDSASRNLVLAATNKLDYIFGCLDQMGVDCEVISASGSPDTHTFPHERRRISDHITLDLPKSFGRKNCITKILDEVGIRLSVFRKLMGARRDDTVIVYHSLYYMSVVRWAKRLKHFKLIIEAEEIYGDVLENQRISQQETSFFHMADGYIFPTELMNDSINVQGKPHAIIYGTYQTEPPVAEKFQDGKIHCVYAGTLDPRKGGADMALDAAQFLPADYHIHILGFGSTEDTAAFLEKLGEVQQKSQCTVTYDGVLSGKAYIQFLQSCHIGLSTQNPLAAFNNTSFPSKVLSYLANGLRVVSVRIPVLEQSDVHSLLYYYEGNSAESLAAAIRKVDARGNYDSRIKVAELDRQWRADFSRLLSDA